MDTKELAVRQNEMPAVAEAHVTTALMNNFERDLAKIELEMKRMELAEKLAKYLVSSSLVPKHFRGENNIGNAIIATDLAIRMGMNPLTVCKELYIVNDTISFSSKFLITCIEMSGRFSPLEFEDVTSAQGIRGIRAYATDLRTGKKLTGAWVTSDMPGKAGWKSPLWNISFEQQAKYRAAAFWQRLHAPSVSMGILTKEEEEDIASGGRTIAVDTLEDKPNEGATIGFDAIPPAPAEQEQEQEQPVTDNQSNNECPI